MSHYRLSILNSILLLVLLAAMWGRRVESAGLQRSDFLHRIDLPFPGWTSSDVEISARDRQLLEPDAVLVREYRSPQGRQAELTVIAGHRKRSVHTPGFCMAGSGWDTLWEKGVALPLAGHRICANQALMSRGRRQLLVTYFYTDGDYCTESLLRFQGAQLLKRLRARAALGALVRITMSAERDEEAARSLSADFARSTVPAVLAALHRARLELE